MKNQDSLFLRNLLIIIIPLIFGLGCWVIFTDGFHNGYMKGKSDILQAIYTNITEYGQDYLTIGNNGTAMRLTGEKGKIEQIRNQEFVPDKQDHFNNQAYLNWTYRTYIESNIAPYILIRGENHDTK